MTLHDNGGGFLASVTPVLLTYNEAPNIARVLDKLAWAQQVVVVDSGSDDETLQLAAHYPNVRCIHRPFDNHASQWNFAVGETGIRTEWILAMDADYLLTDELIDEIAGLRPAAHVAGYETCFRYCVAGKPLRGTLYPPVTTLFRRAGARYEQDGHTQRLKLTGHRQRLRAWILHDDRKPLSRWLWSQERYATLEADVLLRTEWRALKLQDRLRRMLVITPWLVPLYCLIVGGGLLDGKAGFYYAFQRGVAEAMLSLKLLERQLGAPR